MKIDLDPARPRQERSLSRRPRRPALTGRRAELGCDAVWLDERFEYDQSRMLALAPESNTLYYVAFVDRVDATGTEVRRIISLRPATRNEVKHYVESH
jgi:uncharacterized DUF497 family protein